MNENYPGIEPSTSTVVEDVSIPLDELLEAPPFDDSDALPEPLVEVISGVVIGTLVGWNNQGQPLVDFPSNSTGYPLPASTTAILQREDRGRQVALMFHGGDPQKPLLMGLIQEPQVELSLAEGVSQQAVDSTLVQAQVDKERLVFEADKEIVLKCGKASITLTRAGKVLIRGAFLLSRSSGVNRIKGGSVQIN